MQAVRAHLEDISPWQRELARAIREPAQLLELLGLDAEPRRCDSDREAARDFPLIVPRGFVARMRKGDRQDPLLLQVLPQSRERVPVAGFSRDPLAEAGALVAPGLLQKYSGRALLVTTGACAVHCRYCFRRHFAYGDAIPPWERWERALAAIRGDETVTEVILSGGDPLMLPDRPLSQLVRGLEAIGHLKRLRIHTRLPIVLPERVDDALAAWLERCRLPVVIVVHANHSNEIDGAVRRSLARLKTCCATLFNQAVLLRGVNDDAPVLAALSEALFDAGVQPYYLHLLDRVQGAAHFEVEELEAQRIVAELRASLPGYLVPRLVREQSGAPNKIAL